MQIVHNKAIQFRTRNPHKYSIIPKHHVEPVDGGFQVTVYWGLDECRVLQNLGVKDVPSPITKRYNWPGKYKPMSHQMETASFLTMHRKAFVFSEPGTGKTLSALWAADYLMSIGKVRRCLILCPLSIMQSAWLGDLNNSIIHRSAIVAHHAQATRRIEMVQEDYEFVIANYDGLNLIANEVNADGRFDLIIVDECFVAGTLVATPQGRRPIEQLQAGDKVLTSDGVMRINKLVRNTTHQLVEVKLGNGKTIRCTPEHPFFTDAGWVCAKNLAGRRLISGTELSCLRAGISPRAFPGALGYGEQPTPWSDLLEILRTEEVALSEPQQKLLLQHAARATGQIVGTKDSGAPSEVVSGSKGDGSQTQGAGRQRYGDYAHGTADFRGLTCGMGMELPSSVGQEAARLSYELQARLCVPGEEDWAGSGRKQSHGSSATSARPPEGSQTRGAWVASVAYIECPDEEAVYNLEVEGTPNYFVGDHWLVHNCNAYKNITTRRWKALKSIIKPTTHLWMMTGTPASQSPVDAYGLAKLVNPDGVPQFFTGWRDKVMQKLTMYKWSAKPEAQALVHEALQPAIRFTKEQCLDLPPVLTTTREVPLTAQQAKYYNLLKERMLVQAAGETITAVNAAAAVSKLLQISCIAYNTPVLTQLGWMPICNVTSDDYVWDGEYWVRCEGAVFKGMRQTMVLDGVTLTPEHLVLTDSGWKPAEECANGYASKRFGRTEVRIPDGFGEKHLAGATDTLRLAATRSINSEGETAVFDLVNCGPRNRFVVRGDNGEHLIVHNCGAAYTEDREVVEFDSAPRLNVLEEILEETNRKVIIFALFRSTIDTIINHLTKKGYNCDTIHGDVTPPKRADIIRRFQNEKDPHVLVMQPQATAHGITLTAADTVVFYGPLMSVEQYIQCIARADRKGQNSDKVTVVHIESSPIEKKMFKALVGKVDDHGLLTQMFNTEIK